ncbi:MAG: type II toxin-antitoxin system RelE/ParE family toxin [Clostridium sp.]|nr:type II toxin-antitoxin system RelE/ParE family toxin [Clostridium sp.]MCM1398783.1 type II toxin-antitoxin system RelE/ParE family toxin [Clostridium sp.]MCM1458585.1 type II toxin-antitoxin system RelE/ParE family toxin [Bacteroides sp.]
MVSPINGKSVERIQKLLQIEYSKKAAKYINGLDKPTRQRIKTAIEGLTETPPRGDIKTLQGYSDGRKRLRVGQYRIIYNYLPNGEIEVLYIINVDSRGDIYK